jgi:hypothetical protein
MLPLFDESCPLFTNTKLIRQSEGGSRTQDLSRNALSPSSEEFPDALCRPSPMRPCVARNASPHSGRETPGVRYGPPSRVPSPICRPLRENRARKRETGYPGLFVLGGIRTAVGGPGQSLRPFCLIVTSMLGLGDARDLAKTAAGGGTASSPPDPLTHRSGLCCRDRHSAHDSFGVVRSGSALRCQMAVPPRCIAQAREYG